MFSTHQLLAFMSKTPELQLAEFEANMLAKSIGAVNEHYDFGGSFAPEALAWISLVQVAAMVYGPRFVAIRMRRKSDAAQDVTPPGDPMSGMMAGMVA